MGPSTTKPSGRPCSLLARKLAKVFEAMIARNHGRTSGAVWFVADELRWVESGQPLVVGCRADDRDAIGRRLTRGEQIEDVRDLLGDAGSHQHRVDTGQHRAVQRVERRELDLLEVVDPDETVVAVLGEPDLGEVGEHGQVDERRRWIESLRRHGEVARAGRSAAGAVVATQHTFDDVGSDEVSRMPGAGVRRDRRRSIGGRARRRGPPRTPRRVGPFGKRPRPTPTTRHRRPSRLGSVSATSSVHPIPLATYR